MWLVSDTFEVGRVAKALGKPRGCGPVQAPSRARESRGTEAESAT